MAKRERLWQPKPHRAVDWNERAVQRALDKGPVLAAPAVQGEPAYWLVRNEYEGYMQFHDHPPRDCDISPYGLDEIIPLYAAPQPVDQESAPDVAALVEALEGIMRVEARGRVMPVGAEWDAARAALATHRKQDQKELNHE